MMRRRRVRAGEGVSTERKFKVNHIFAKFGCMFRSSVWVNSRSSNIFPNIAIAPIGIYDRNIYIYI